MKRLFDVLIKENNIEYGVIKGNDKLLYIKVGNGGSIYGYANKYLSIAKQINGEYGLSILVASNPIELAIKESIKYDNDFIDRYFPNTKDIYAFGHSNGGQMLVSFAYLNPKIKKVLSVNVPLMINLHKTKEGISKFNGEHMTMIYGEKDPSFRYVEILDSSVSSKFSYYTIKNANHHFENMLEEFILLPKQFLF
ncbi:MAG: alpha/beta hydrolase [Clostridia bacterium]|nr:alpha/beta hydrolase [Clostridia bacterium]